MPLSTPDARGRRQPVLILHACRVELLSQRTSYHLAVPMHGRSGINMSATALRRYRHLAAGLSISLKRNTIRRSSRLLTCAFIVSGMPPRRVTFKARAIILSRLGWRHHDRMMGRLGADQPFLAYSPHNVYTSQCWPRRHSARATADGKKRLACAGHDAQQSRRFSLPARWLS